MTVILRNLHPGDRFILCRSGEAYTFIERRHRTPGGTEYVVKRDGDEHESTLHRACYVRRIGGGTPCK